MNRRFDERKKKKIFHFVEEIRFTLRKTDKKETTSFRLNGLKFPRAFINVQSCCRLAKVAPSSNRTTVPKYEKEENKGEGIKRSFYVRACNRRDERATKETIGRRESLVSGRFFPSFESDPSATSFNSRYDYFDCFRI